jgi:alkaline phosphatase D
MKAWLLFLFASLIGPKSLGQMPLWLGGVDSHSAKLTAFPSEQQSKREGIWEILDPASGIIRRLPFETQKIGNTVLWKAEARDLDENRSYLYRLIAQGQDSSYSGSFRTFSKQPLGFRFVGSSCSFALGSPAYLPMMEFYPHLFLHLGDLHYADVQSPQIEDHLKPYITRFLNGKKEQRFCLQVPMDYIWDDHDYCGNNSAGPSACGNAARDAYLGAFPGYAPYRQAAGLAHSFQNGRVRFIVLDLRSERTDSTIMSREQMNWLKEELRYAHRNNQLALILSSVSWYGNETDNWGGFPEERQEIIAFMEQNNLHRVAIICGDAHMNALDDGSNASVLNPNQATNNPAKKAIPVIQAGALLSFGSNKGGSYSHGAFVNPLGAGQWVECQIVDNDAGAIALRVTGQQMMAGYLEPKTLFHETFFWPLPTSKKHLDLFSIERVGKQLNITISSNAETAGSLYRLRTSKGSILDAAAAGELSTIKLSATLPLESEALFLEEERLGFNRVFIVATQ